MSIINSITDMIGFTNHSEFKKLQQDLQLVQDELVVKDLKIEKLEKELEKYKITKKYSYENELRLKLNLQTMKKNMDKLNKVYQTEFDKMEQEKLKNKNFVEEMTNEIVKEKMKIKNYLDIKSSNYFATHIPLKELLEISKTNPNILFRCIWNSASFIDPKNQHLKHLYQRWEKNFYSFFTKDAKFIYNNKLYDCEVEMTEICEKRGGRNNGERVVSRNIICNIDGYNYTIGRIITTISNHGRNTSSIFELNPLFEDRCNVGKFEKQNIIKDIVKETEDFNKQERVEKELNKWLIEQYKENRYLMTIPPSRIQEKKNELIKNL